MNRNLPVPAAPAPRVIHYVHPAPATDTSLLLHGAAELATRRRQEQILYARWLARRAVQTERDRKVRRFWLGFGAVVGTAVVAGLVVLGWLAYHAIAAVGTGLLGIAAAVALVALLGFAGHRCVTVIQHWH